MSSLRNAVKRRTHKERAQPAGRSRLGLLEKHKDYVLRAKDFHKKQDAIQTLRQKASQRNPDEFYFGMINSQSVGGIHRPKGLGKQYTQEELELMKTQDIKYLMIKAQNEKKKADALRAVVHSTAQASAGNHLYFAEDREEATELEPIVASRQEVATGKNRLPRKLERARESANRQLSMRTERAEKLQSMVAAMTMQKELMGKGRKRKLRDDEVVGSAAGPVYKWRQERKK